MNCIIGKQSHKKLKLNHLFLNCTRLHAALQKSNINTPRTHSQTPVTQINHLTAPHTLSHSSPALEGLTLQHTESWDFPTPPHRPRCALCQSGCAALRAHRQLQTHTHTHTHMHFPAPVGICQNKKKEKLWYVRALDKSRKGEGGCRKVYISVLFLF